MIISRDLKDEGLEFGELYEVNGFAKRFGVEHIELLVGSDIRHGTFFVPLHSVKIADYKFQLEKLVSLK